MKKKARNEPCPCGNGKKYKACHGNGSAPVVRVTFRLKPDVDHHALLKLPENPQPIPCGQVANNEVQSFFDPWEDAYGLGPAEQLLADEGREQLVDLIRRATPVDDSGFGDYMQCVFASGNGSITVASSAIDGVETDWWTWESPSDPRVNADLN